MSEAQSGWHAISMRCPDCATGGVCRTCNGTGWHPNSHVLNEGLFVGGICVAKVERFSDAGCFYANAITPGSEFERSGPMDDHGAAVEWCERTAGVVPVRLGAETEGGHG